MINIVSRARIRSTASGSKLLVRIGSVARRQLRFTLGDTKLTSIS